MRIWLLLDYATSQHLDPLRWRMAPWARRPDDVGLFGLGLLLEGITDETSSLNQQHDLAATYA
jgi:hypothetical protein